MKRHWRASRIFVAALLLSVTALMFYLWPIVPRWRIEMESPLGFDLSNGLLYSCSSKMLNPRELFELHGYDLATGELKVVKPVMLEKPARDFPVSWHAILSSERTTMSCYDNASTLQIFNIRDLPQRLFSINEPFIYSLSFSADGKLLALHHGIDQLDVWDCQTGTVIKRLKLPAKESSAGFGSFGCHPESMQFSSDGRYLALGSDDNVIVLFDLTTDRIIGQCPDSHIPVFLPDSQTLIALPACNSSYLVRERLRGKAQWYRLCEGQLTPHPLSYEILSVDAMFKVPQAVATDPGRILTLHEDDTTQRSLPEWIPDAVRERLEAALGWTKRYLLVQLFETGTGRVRHTFKLRTGVSESSFSCENIRVSPDGLLLAFKDDNELILWDIPPRRSFVCWLVCGVIAFFVICLAWPKRMNPPPVTKSGAA